MSKDDKFTIEHTTETFAAPEAVWALFRDTERWSEWNRGVESIRLEGPFAEGTWFSMKTPEQPEPLRSCLVDVRENESFVDETRVGDLVVRVTHRLSRAGEKTRITYALAAEGPGASQLGPAIASDFPDVLAALAKRVTTA